MKQTQKTSFLWMLHSDYFLLLCFQVLFLCDTVCAQLLSRVWSFATPWTVARQAPLSMGFPRQEYWSGLPFPPPGDLPDPGIEPASPAPALADESSTAVSPRKPSVVFTLSLFPCNGFFISHIVVSFSLGKWLRWQPHDWIEFHSWACVNTRIVPSDSFRLSLPQLEVSSLTSKCRPLLEGAICRSPEPSLRFSLHGLLQSSAALSSLDS